MHSRSTDFIDDETTAEKQSIPAKQFGGIHRAGGSQFKNWSLQTAQVKEKPLRSVEFRAAGYRGIGAGPKNDLGEFSIESATDPEL